MNIKSLYNNISSKFPNSSKLWKVLSVASISTFTRTVTSFIIGKLAAIWLGPSGIALMGQLGNVVSIVNTLGAGLLENGTTTLVAQKSEEKEQVSSIISKVFKISIVTSIIIGVLIIVFSGFLSKTIFPVLNYNKYIIVTGIFVILSATSNLLAAIINGMQQFNKLIAVNILTNILVSLLTISSMYFYKIEGALFSIIIAQPICFYISYFILKNKIKIKPISIRLRKLKFSKIDRQLLGSYFIMGFFQTIVMPATSFVVRSIIISKQSVENAGFWESIVKIGYIYSSFILMGISYYFFPLISTMKGYNEIRTQIKIFIISIIPLFILGCVVIYFLREHITLILFTKEFVPINNLYLGQLCGEVLKVIGGLYVMVLWSKNHLKEFIVAQILYSFFFIVITYYLADTIGPLSGVMGFLGASCIYLVFLVSSVELLYYKSRSKIL